MENMLWKDLGPDLMVFARHDGLHPSYANLIRTYGEIRFRYAAHLTQQLVPGQTSSEWLSMIDRALRRNWMTGHCLQRMAQIYHRSPASRLERIEIPWLRVRMPRARRDELRLIEEVATDDEDSSERVLRELCKNPDELHNGPMLSIDAILHPDLRLETVIIWLCFLVEGDQDPQLCSVHKRYEPQMKIKGFRRYLRAWRALIEQ